MSNIHSSKVGMERMKERFLLKSRETKKAEFQAMYAIKYLQEIVQLEFGAF